MALTLVTNPVGEEDVKLFAGFQPCEFIFKREDLAITSVTSGAGGAKINHTGDLTSVLSAGDYVYLYSEGTNIVYDGSFEIISIVAGEIDVDTAYIGEGTGGYVNYLKNYYVEMQCVSPTTEEGNLLPFSLQSDGEANGDISVDVSIINELNTQRGDIETGYIGESATEFEVRYREVYDNSSNSFTLIDDKMLVMLYAINKPTEDVVLNRFDVPKIYLGYPAAIALAITARSAATTCELRYSELGINANELTTSSLGTQSASVNGFLTWEWSKNKEINSKTKYIEFNFDIVGTNDYDPNDYDPTEYKTT